MSASSLSARLSSAVREALPRGQTLPERDWASRHRAMTWVLWAHVIGLPAFALLRGFSVVSSVGPVVPVAMAGLVGSLPALGRRARSVAIVFGLLTSSAVLVHAWNGRIEAHFHYFVMIAVIALYEDWLPFGLAVAYVVIEHGLLGALSPHSVYDHGGNAWEWAGIHGFFVLGSVAACVAAWRLNEEMRERMGAAHDRAREIDERFRLAFETGVAGMSLCAPDGLYLSVNRAMCEITGYSEEELIGSDFRTITHPDDRAAGGELICALMEGQADTLQNEKRYVHRDGHIVWVQFGASAVRDEAGAVEYFITQVTDITERKQFEDQLAQRALHDPLTGLANRALFGDRLDQALVRLRRHDTAVAVLFVDLDRFKLVNDGMGHPAGDAVIVETARRLSEVVRAEDTVARFGGDEFTVLCELADEAGAARVAQAILDAVARPFSYRGREFHLGASIGVRTTTSAGAKSDALLRDADTALYTAKRHGRGRFELFDFAAQYQLVDALATDQALRVALAYEEFRLHYQPEIDLATGRIVAVEALLRWDNPGRGLVPPGEFIPVAEETGVIVPMGEWVVYEACRQLAEWRAGGAVGRDLRMAVNVSARQLSHPGLPAAVASALAAAELEPGALCVEITESALVQDGEVALANVHELKELGVRVALDDFGVGFSSFSQIRELPAVDVIKIDRSFTAGLDRSRSDAAIVDAVLSLARSLGVVVVAEGVETAEQVELLRDLGCDIGQGFFFARPQPPADAAVVLAEGVIALPSDRDAGRAVA